MDQRSLGLSTERLATVKDIHERCERECTTSTKATGTMDHATMGGYEKELRAAMTPEQFTK